MRVSVFSVTDHYPGLGRTLADFYAQVLDEVSLAEQLGFSAYFVAEHHFNEYGVVPSPPALLGAAAARTERIGLGVAVSVLPFHHPLVVAEEYAMIDQISGGRLVLGVGSGYLKHEFDGWPMGPWEKRARFDEALEILLQAWEGRPFSYHGLYYSVRNTRIAVTPLQRPHPPVWVAILRGEAAYHVGRQGRDIMLIPYATTGDLDELREVVDGYLRGRAESGHPGEGPPDIAVALHTHVAETRDLARRQAESALDRYIRTRLYAKHRTLEELDAHGLLLLGDADTVAERIIALRDLGVTHLMVLANFGGLEPALVHASLERFAGEVMPRIAGSPVEAVERRRSR